MSNFTNLDPTAKLPCPYIYGAAILGKLHEFLCSSFSWTTWKLTSLQWDVHADTRKFHPCCQLCLLWIDSHCGSGASSWDGHQLHSLSHPNACEWEWRSSLEASMLSLPNPSQGTIGSERHWTLWCLHLRLHLHPLLGPGQSQSRESENLHPCRARACAQPMKISTGRKNTITWGTHCYCGEHHATNLKPILVGCLTYLLEVCCIWLWHEFRAENALSESDLKTAILEIFRLFTLNRLTSTSGNLYTKRRPFPSFLAETEWPSEVSMVESSDLQWLSNAAHVAFPMLLHQLWRAFPL